MNETPPTRSNTMRLPFYRSLVFQLSLPVLLFMLWAWRDSGTFSSKLHVCGRGNVYSIGQYLGAIEFSHFSSELETSMRLAPVREQYDPVVDEKYPYVRGFVFPKAIVSINRSLGEKGVRIAHWLIFVISLIATVAFLLLRRYRTWH